MVITYPVLFLSFETITASDKIIIYNFQTMKNFCDEVELYYEEVYIITILRKYSWRFE
jgi:hypothetical protein